tara:strand:- start:1244 stop:1447 length:204 start_codon:yes stop_codon:yes gene_type:complete
MLEELLYPLSSVGCFINEDLIVYKSKEGKPNLDEYSHISHLASKWVNKISSDDDNLVSELIYWKRNE